MFCFYSAKTVSVVYFFPYVHQMNFLLEIPYTEEKKKKNTPQALYVQIITENKHIVGQLHFLAKAAG